MRGRSRLLLRLACAIIAACSMIAAACSGGSDASPTSTPAPASVTGAMRMSSDAFPDGGTIPVDYTCTGSNTSPPLRWSGAPDGTRAFALIMDDPDAPSGTFDHWVVYDLPPSTTGLAAGAAISGDAKPGKNGRGQTGYTGPCPPPGAPHHYQFRLSALDAPLGLPAAESKASVEAAMQGHVLGQATLVGLYGR